MPLTVAIAGLGAIGAVVARRLDQGIDGLRLAAVAGRDIEKTRAAIAPLGAKPIVCADPGELARHADVVVDCAPGSALRTIAEPALAARRIVMTVNAATLLDTFDLVDKARASGGRIIVPTGALLGLDAVRAASETSISSVTMITRKPPKGLAGAPYLAANKIDVMAMTESTRIFTGSAREAARGFPANVNVAAALSLAGIGPDRTRIEIWAEPTSGRNQHTIEVEADAARFTMTIAGVPTPENPRTGKLTPLSVIACLRGLVSPLKIGS
jgi:aspartate dehydrogenase